MKIRKAVLADAKGIAKVHVDSWKTTYDNIVPAEYLKRLSYESREQLWKNSIPNGGVYVSETSEGEIVGFASGGKERTGKYPDYAGELYAIYILKEYQGNGLGSLLVKPLIDELQLQNISTMLVLVLEDNSSRLFYETLGAKKIDTIEVEFLGQKVQELVYGWSDIRNIFKK
ncbi:GNAT family N-acetyltransferase [Neobacillus sp. WH10]|uniref:GNAT family N-acetyltransferase n=1 Tax=Neobacillus sp. WH10 TaxID=3047873 RepID=UPI0024C1D88D|nr:GNAT family N-acetyltransferase [Neobacillus sp. WH10]WHY78484.1 GNAT family N-acetyltransferase [Neobacillus sp. WH10]